MEVFVRKHEHYMRIRKVETFILERTPFHEKQKHRLTTGNDSNGSGQLSKSRAILHLVFDWIY